MAMRAEMEFKVPTAFTQSAVISKRRSENYPEESKWSFRHSFEIEKNCSSFDEEFRFLNVSKVSTPINSATSAHIRSNETTDSGVLDLSFTTPPNTPTYSGISTAGSRTHGLHRSQSRITSTCSSLLPRRHISFDESSSFAGLKDTPFSLLGCSSGVCSQSEITKLIQVSLDKLMAVSPKLIIGKRMGRESVNVLASLAEMNLHHVISQILSHLPANDIYALSMVNLEYAYLMTPYVKKKTGQQQPLLDQENVIQERTVSRRTTATETRLAFSSIQPQAAKSRPSPIKSPSKQSRSGVNLSKRFWKEASSLLMDESLRKCPQCFSPSRTHEFEERAICTNSACAFDFCIRCRSKYHVQKDCGCATPKKARVSVPVGSTKSKKNLRRL